ncbi:MAG: M48 family metalloprotease [Candidatus Aminicenantes bacterium]|nr:MAG: M48 family metalloprotease [Candidatus Aminicenantes bacterium]
MKNMKEERRARTKSKINRLNQGFMVFFLFLLSFFLLNCASVEKNASIREEIPTNAIYSPVPVTEEGEYARRLASEIEKDAVILKEEFVNEYLEEIGQRIDRNLRWSCKVIDSSDVNAFAALGGLIYFTRGLIEKVKSESELAGALAFEIGHVLANHIYQHLYTRLKDYPDITPDEIIKGEKDWERLLQVFKMKGGALAFFSELKHSHSQVAEADEFALSSTYDAEFNPKGFVNLVSRLGEEGKPSNSWLIRNPWTREREEKILSNLKLLPSFNLPEEHSRFASFKARLGSLSTLRKGTDIPPIESQEIVHGINVLGNANWTDTGLGVMEGQEVYFRARGRISLQKGNPMAHCDPDGYDYRGIQQPILNKNVGALIGKVVQLISIEIDEETGEEIRNEIEEIFYVGRENKVVIPLRGRLFLGINENVAGDNSGQFKVEIYLKKM